jgi:RimJ/RimL family protein N-acetyltransferase
VGDGQPLGRDDCVRWVEVTQRNYATRGYGMSAVELLEQQGAVIGFCGLVHPGGQPEAEIKYALLRQHWGSGYASEVAAALLAYGARQFGLSEIIATAAPDNLASHRVLQKAGMRQASVRRNDDGTCTLVFVWWPDDGAQQASLQ